MIAGSKSPQKIIWIAFGPVGEALMMLALFDEILSSTPNTVFIVVTTRNGKLIRDLCAEYLSVTVYELPKRNPLKLAVLIARLLAVRSLVIAPGVVSVHSRPMEMLIKVLSLRGGNQTVAFSKSSGSTSSLGTVEFDYYGRLYIDNLRALAASAGLLVRSGALHVRLPSIPPKDAPKPDSYIHVHMFASSPGRSLPHHRWTTLLSTIAERYSRYQIIVTSIEADAEQARRIIEDIPAYLMIGLPMSEMAWLIAHARLYIGVDTGITHMAGVLQKESVVIANRSNPVWLPTYNPNAHILTNETHCTCDGKKGGNCIIRENGITYYRCLYEIRDEDILAAIDSGLSRAANRA